jgi:hypothetical protein
MLKISSRPMIVALAAAAIGFPPAVHAGAVAQAEAIHVTLTPTCGCCGAWAEFAEAHGFAVEREITEDYLGMKQAGSVPEELWSCHTATIGGYTIEGQFRSPRSTGCSRSARRLPGFRSPACRPAPPAWATIRTPPTT